MFGFYKEDERCIDRKQKADSEISTTICHIIRDFFQSAGDETFVYFYCDDEDGRHDCRYNLFERWHRYYNHDGYFRKEDIRIEVEEDNGSINNIYHSLLFRNDHPHPSIIIQEFFDTSSLIAGDKDPDHIVL